MDGEHKMPIAFQMALAHNEASMSAFLKMSNERQDKIISQANEIKTVREMHNFVDSIGKMY